MRKWKKRLLHNRRAHTMRVVMRTTKERANMKRKPYTSIASILVNGKRLKKRIQR